MTLFNKSACALAFVCVGAQTLVASLVSSTPSMKEYATESAKLNVYSDVPGHEKSVIKGYASRSKSDIYEIRVRSAATGNEWVQCFANKTYNRGKEMPVIERFKTGTATHAYQRHTAGWTHTYANIFRCIGHIAGGAEDCDILYARWRDPRGVGNVFEFASYNGVKPKATQLNAIFRNNRFHDKLANPRHLIGLGATETFTGLRFENMTFYSPLNQRRSVIKGSKEAPYAGQAVFKNIMFQNGSEESKAVKISGLNYKDYFESNEFVEPNIFE